MVTAALRKAAKDQYLPEGFAFSGSKDNVLLDRVAAHGLALSAD